MGFKNEIGDWKIEHLIVFLMLFYIIATTVKSAANYGLTKKKVKRMAKKRMESGASAPSALPAEQVSSTTGEPLPSPATVVETVTTASTGTGQQFYFHKTS